MKILISDDKVLDTKEGKIINDISNYDIEKKNVIIVYHIVSPNGNKFCDIAIANKGIKTHMPYNAAINSIIKTNREYYEVDEKIAIPSSILFLNDILANYQVETKGTSNNTQMGNITVTGVELSSEESEQQLKENIAKFGGGNIIMDIDALRLEESDQKMICRELIVEAKKVIKDHFPYYYCILKQLEELYLNKESSEREGLDVMAVVPGTLLINTDACCKLSQKQIVFILCHEVCHLVLRHLSREKLRNHNMWNFAGDLVINKNLSEEMHITPNHPGPLAEMCMGIFSPDVDTSMTTEEVYAQLLAQKKAQDMSNMPPMPGDGPIGGQSGGNGSQSGQNGDQNNKQDNQIKLNDELRQILNRIRELEQQPVNKTVAPLIERTIKKYDIENRISALGI